jgi:hypothetical protein
MGACWRRSGRRSPDAESASLRLCRFGIVHGLGLNADELRVNKQVPTVAGAKAGHSTLLPQCHSTVLASV